MRPVFFNHMLYTAILPWLATVTQCFATAQLPDKLVYNGDTLAIFSNPLEQLPGIDSLRPLLFGAVQETVPTNCARGYQAIWTLSNNELFLSGICSCYGKENRQASLKQLFAGTFQNGQVKASWVNSNIHSPQGRLLLYVHAGYESLYETDVIFRIEQGRLTEIVSYDNSMSVRSAYSNDSTLLAAIYSGINWKILPENAKDTKVLITFSANENGIIDSIDLKKAANPLYGQEVIRVLKTLAPQSILYRFGKFYRQTCLLPVDLSAENRMKYRPE